MIGRPCDRCGRPKAKSGDVLESGRFVCTLCYSELSHSDRVVDDGLVRTWLETKRGGQHRKRMGALARTNDWRYDFESLDRDAATMASNLGLLDPPTWLDRNVHLHPMHQRKVPLPLPVLSYQAFQRSYYREPVNGELLPACSELRPYAFTRFVKLHLPLLLYTEVTTLDFTRPLDRWYIMTVMMEEKVSLPTFYLNLAQAMALLGSELKPGGSLPQLAEVLVKRGSR